MYSKSDSEVSKYLINQTHLNNFGEEVIDICTCEENDLLSAQAAYQKIRQTWLKLQKSLPEITDRSNNN